MGIWVTIFGQKAPYITYLLSSSYENGCIADPIGMLTTVYHNAHVVYVICMGQYIMVVIMAQALSQEEKLRRGVVITAGTLLCVPKTHSVCSISY